MRVTLVPHSVEWKTFFKAESDQIAATLGDDVVAVHHIGSTAIAGIVAKPVIDILLEVKDIVRLDMRASSLQQLGYEGLGEYGIPGRRYFRKNDASGRRTHQLHTFQTGDPSIERHIAFRDYMIAHPIEAREYGALKEDLGRKHANDIIAYMDGKDPFIKDREVKAVLWQRALHHGIRLLR